MTSSRRASRGSRRRAGRRVYGIYDKGVDALQTDLPDEVLKVFGRPVPPSCSELERLGRSVMWDLFFGLIESEVAHSCARCSVIERRSCVHAERAPTIDSVRASARRVRA